MSTPENPVALLAPIASARGRDARSRAGLETSAREELLSDALAASALIMAGKGGRKSPGSSGGDGEGQGGGDSGAGTAVIARTRPKTQRPSMYRVLLLNDDYTPMDFVIGVLCSFFHKSFEDANRIMWEVHTNGVGECGVYTYEVADTKVTQVMDHARKHQHPLQCVMEKK